MNGTFIECSELIAMEWLREKARHTYSNWSGNHINKNDNDNDDDAKKQPQIEIQRICLILSIFT